MGFQQQLAHLYPTRLVSKTTSLSNTLPNKELTLGTNQQPRGRHHGVNLIGKPMTTQPDQNQHMSISRRFFLLKSETISIFGKKLDYFHLKDFLEYECELYVKQPLTPPQRKMIVAYHRLPIEFG